MQEDINILVVDDKTALISSYEKMLRQEGYNVQSAMSLKEAMPLMEAKSYNLAVIDLGAPEEAGVSVIERLRQSRPDTGIVVTTEHPSQETIQKAVEMGCIDYVPKPFTPVMLTDITHRALERMKETAVAETGDFTPAMVAELDSVIDEYRDIPGSLIPVLQRAQGIVGYLPPEVQRHISNGLKMPTAEIHSVVSFYSFFTMKPRGKYLIRLCLGTACYVKKSEAILEKFKSELNIDVEEVTPDRKFSLETVRCLGACGLAPVAMVNEDTYGALHPKKVTEVINAY